ncbi:putative glycoside hydrolase [Biformimicrobium ophioploci]|nr:putative glycoside hydrolase [Microbulbifer sp. NKW57]
MSASKMFLFFALSAFLCSFSAASEPAKGEKKPPAVQGVMFAGGATIAPWRFYIGNPNEWMRPVKTQQAKTRSPSNVKIEMLTEDSGLAVLKAQWQKGSTGQILWQGDSSINAAAIAEHGGALSLVLRVDEVPDKPVSLRMDCGYPCSGSLKFGDILSALPKGEWLRIGIPLACFENAGTDLRKIDSPAVIVTSGNLGLSILDLRLALDVPKASMISCSA